MDELLKIALDAIHEDIREIKDGVGKINGRVRKNEIRMAMYGGGLTVLIFVIGLWAKGLLKL